METRWRQGTVWRALAVAALCIAALAGCDAAPTQKDRTLRIATFNLHLARGTPGALIEELRTGSAQIDAIRDVIAHVDPDVLVLQELDYDAEGKALALFRDRLGDAGMHYAFSYAAPVNTGVPTGLDLNGNGKTYGPENAQGWGLFPGQFGMAVLSRLPIREAGIRTFQNLRWGQLPDSLFPGDFYPVEAAEALRLSSKSHWDVPLEIGTGDPLHLLISHPTPPVFDGPEDRNGRRNHDEIRFWVDYLDGAGWIVDDNGRRGGLEHGASVVVAGDLNNDPDHGDGRSEAIQRLLSHPRLTDVMPRRSGSSGSARERPHATADWSDGGADAPGALRVDYLIPSRSLRIISSAVVWPDRVDPLWTAANRASDHRMVWIDLKVQ